MIAVCWFVCDNFVSSADCSCWFRGCIDFPLWDTWCCCNTVSMMSWKLTAMFTAVTVVEISVIQKFLGEMADMFSI